MITALLPRKRKKQMTNTFIYTLGNGWNPYNRIPNDQKSPSILKGVVATGRDKFPPLGLFDGTLEAAFGNFYNWRVEMQPMQNVLEEFLRGELNREAMENEKLRADIKAASYEVSEL